MSKSDKPNVKTNTGIRKIDKKDQLFDRPSQKQNKQDQERFDRSNAKVTLNDLRTRRQTNRSK
jgi:hypothetical protein